LLHLGGHGVGIDHNPHSVAIARSRGLTAFTAEEFERSEFRKPEHFDSLLLSHVVEPEEQVVALLKLYTPLLKPKGEVIFIAPQEAGYRSDPTHVQFMDFSSLEQVAAAAGLVPLSYSFPFPRLFGRVFQYNEFVTISRKPERP
jgi:2-polyprenyl-3-methyl-5-hydroxy-6-metoxy-1,4-benzoquinol methylase